MPKEIVQKNNPVLRKVAVEVPIKDIASPKIQKVLKEMSASLAGCDDGVAIAAPQIGVSLRIFVVSGQALARVKKENSSKPDLIFINPRIIKKSSKKVLMDEGCLSVRWIYGKIKRSEKATVEAYNEKGEKFTKSSSGLMAQIFQHEIDHLDGVLFIDNATNLEEIKPEENLPR